MENRLKKLLFDVLISCENIEVYMLGCDSFQEFDEDVFLQHSIERNIEIIGEALKNVRNINPEISISRLNDIINTRNKLIHGYDSIDNTIIYTIVVKHIPILKEEVTRLIDLWFFNPVYQSLRDQSDFIRLIRIFTRLIREI